MVLSDITAIHYGSTLITAVYVHGVQIWPVEGPEDPEDQEDVS